MPRWSAERRGPYVIRPDTPRKRVPDPEGSGRGESPGAFRRFTTLTFEGNQGRTPRPPNNRGGGALAKWLLETVVGMRCEAYDMLHPAPRCISSNHSRPNLHIDSAIVEIGIFWKPDCFVAQNSFRGPGRNARVQQIVSAMVLV